mmetsp:Transcript_126627/g.369991  ORF Transcript_126627/g.369991 Transcript_126627/m.369991 type:complete len:211 (+) Transcript_126627:79-711(+)
MLTTCPWGESPRLWSGAVTLLLLKTSRCGCMVAPTGALSLVGVSGAGRRRGEAFGPPGDCLRVWTSHASKVLRSTPAGIALRTETGNGRPSQATRATAATRADDRTSGFASSVALATACRSGCQSRVPVPSSLLSRCASIARPHTDLARKPAILWLENSMSKPASLLSDAVLQISRSVWSASSAMKRFVSAARRKHVGMDACNSESSPGP